MAAFGLGELILKSKPYVYVLDNISRGKRCDSCFKKCDDLKRCSQCSFLYFCNRSCQENAWEMHKKECKFILKSKPNVPTASMRLFALILFKLQKYGEDNPQEDIYGRKVSFKTLMSHAEEIKQSIKPIQQMVALISTLKDYIGESNIPPPSEFIEIFGKMVINSFTISNHDGESIGTGVYLGASVFDHSCNPNAEVVFDGINMYIHAVKCITPRDINKVYISYIEQIEFTEKRQESLLEQYYFLCQCEKCTSPEYNDLMKKLIVSEEEAKQQLEKFREGLENIKEIKKSKVGAATLYSACLQELNAQGEILADTHIYRVKVLETAFDACVWNNQWADAVMIGQQLLKPYRLYYSDYNPAFGVHLFKLGKIQLFLNSPSSYETLKQASEILEITHGKKHPLYQELLENLCDSESLTLSKLSITE